MKNFVGYCTKCGMIQGLVVFGGTMTPFFDTKQAVNTVFKELKCKDCKTEIAAKEIDVKVSLV